VRRCRALDASGVVGEPEPDAQVHQAGRSVSVVRTIHVKLDSGDITTLRQHLPEMRLEDAVRHVLDVWMDDRLGPSPDDALAMLEDADDAGTDG
jgi:hypothetical protein